jgi:hypothetical protein
MSASGLAIFGLVFVVLQVLAMAFFPGRFAAFQLWQYRRIGARPAEPGRGTFLFHRILGTLGFVALSIILISQF